MTVKFINTTTGQELTAGQALDVWIQWLASKVSCLAMEPLYKQIHFFADAVIGYKLERETVRQAGIEIRFGD